MQSLLRIPSPNRVLPRRPNNTCVSGQIPHGYIARPWPPSQRNNAIQLILCCIRVMGSNSEGPMTHPGRQRKEQRGQEITRERQIGCESMRARGKEGRRTGTHYGPSWRPFLDTLGLGFLQKFRYRLRNASFPSNSLMVVLLGLTPMGLELNPLLLYLHTHSLDSFNSSPLGDFPSLPPQIPDLFLPFVAFLEEMVGSRLTRRGLGMAHPSSDGHVLYFLEKRYQPLPIIKQRVSLKNWIRKERVTVDSRYPSFSLFLIGYI